jgi:hypothetical protein
MICGFADFKLLQARKNILFCLQILAYDALIQSFKVQSRKIISKDDCYNFFERRLCSIGRNLQICDLWINLENLRICNLPTDIPKKFADLR